MPGRSKQVSACETRKEERKVLSGKRLVRRLSELNIRCTYALLNSIAAVIDRVGAVILSCECVFANGDALVPTGGAMIALTARHHNIPVIILAPTYKFADKVRHICA